MFEAWGRALYTRRRLTGVHHGLPGLFPAGTVSTAARDREAAAGPHEE